MSVSKQFIRIEVVPYLIDVTLSSITEIFSCFGGNCFPYLQSQRVSRTCNKQTSLCIPEASSHHVRFEVFTALTMKNGVFWDVTPHGSCKNRRFEGT
jgi:hypothetical protein